MSKTDLQEFKADHEGGDVVQGGEVMDPTDAEGGPVQPRLADKQNDEKEDATVTEAFDSLFEGMELSSDFKGKLGLVFEAAVTEAVEEKTASITEQLEEQFKTQLEESVAEAMDSVVENLDSYLDYVVSEWMEENKVAVETGIKVEMAESLLNSLKTVFYEHNVQIDEETIDVVSDLEEQIAVLESKANEVANKNVALAEEIKTLRAEAVFTEMTEGLTTSQTERFRVLSEKLNYDDVASYKDNLSTIKESFFKAKAPVIEEEVEEVLNEEATVKKPVSQYDSVNALAAAISSIKVK